MKYCLFNVTFVLFSSISCSVPLVNECSLKSCSKRSDSNYVLPLSHISCLKSRPCTMSARKTSCSVFPEDSYAISLKNVEIHHDDEGLWIQTTWRSSRYFDTSPQGNQATFVVRLHFNGDKHCHNFAIPAFLIKRYFSLPCVHVSTEVKGNLQLLIGVYYKASDQQMAELVSVQATEYPLNRLRPKQSLGSKHLGVKYHFDEVAFHLTVTHAKCSFLYNVSILEANGTGMCASTGTPLCRKVNLRSHQSSMNCDVSLFKPCQLYCIRTFFRLHGSCSFTYPKVSSEITYFQRADEENLTLKSIPCKNWDATVVPFNNSNEATITIIFSALKSYANCFHCYRVQLYRLFSQICHSTDRMLIGSEIALLKNGQGKARFSNLPNGTFCALIVPCMNSIHKTIGRESQVVSIVHVPKKVPEVPQSQNFSLETLIASILLLSVVGIGVLLNLRKALGSQKQKNDERDEMPIPVPENDPLMPRDIVVYVFDAWNDDASSLLSDLKDFLRTCAGFELVDDMVPLFLRNVTSWVEEMFDYRCSRMGDSTDSTTRYLFVNSGRYKTNAKYNKAKAFKSALTGLRDISVRNGAWKKSERDSCHIFVVYLDNVRCRDGTQDLVPFNQYDIRRNELINLCIHLGYPGSQVEVLQNDLRNHRINDICDA